MNKLTNLVVRGSFHNSGERFDAPTCHEDTRVALRDGILAWLDDITDPRAVMWMNGAAGAGKSAIAQTIAKLLYDQGRLAASFFYSRTSPDLTRRDDSRLLPTLIYQLIRNIPETEQHVSAALANDEFLLDLTLEAQLEKLIVLPISRCSEAMATPVPPRIVIVDGLDESSSKVKQRQIIRDFTAAFTRLVSGTNNYLPLKLLIASRSDFHILSTFSDASVAGHVSVMPLDSHPDVDDDIRRYLTVCFSTIKRLHPLKNIFDPQWPRKTHVEELVRRSSGQFIYPATVKKYIESQRHNPVQRLRTIIRLARDPNAAPYADLDVLYKHILQQLTDDAQELVLKVFHVILIGTPYRLSTRQVSNPDQLSLLQHLFDVSEDDIRLALADLSSILVIESRSIRFLHASFSDFLCDETRSSSFCIWNFPTCAAVFRACFEILPRLDGISQANVQRVCGLFCCSHFLNIASRHPQLLSDIPDLFRSIDLHRFLWIMSRRGADVQIMLEFIEMLFTEAAYFPNGVQQVQDWMRAQIRKIPGPNIQSPPSGFEWIRRIVFDSELGLWWKLMTNSGSTARRVGRLIGRDALSQEKYSHFVLQCIVYLFNHLPERTDATSILHITGVIDYVVGFLDCVEPEIALYFAVIDNLRTAHDDSTAPGMLPSCLFHSSLVDAEQGSNSVDDTAQLTSYLEAYFRRQIFWTSTAWSVVLAQGLVRYFNKTRAAFPSLEATLNDLD